MSRGRPPKRFEVEGRSLSLHPNGDNGVLRHGKLGRRETTLRKYGLFEWTESSNIGEPRGIVGLEAFTFERQQPGRRYVDRRWQAPRWYFIPTDPSARHHRRDGGYDTRIQAVRRCLERYDALAKDRMEGDGT